MTTQSPFLDRIGRFPAVAAALAALAAASAQASDVPARDKSGYHLFNPTPTGFMRDLSTDRPDTTESAYTVDAGHLQLEMSFVDFRHDRNNGDSQTRRAFSVAPLLVKVGLLNNVDLQVGVNPYTREEASDESGWVDGFGDTLVRVKFNLWGNDGGDTAFAIMPFVKFPTAADDLGNGDTEGGLIAALGAALPDEWSLGTMAQLDYNRSAADDRYVNDIVHTVTASRRIVGDLAGYLEYAGFANLNGDEDYRGYFDAGLTLGVSKDVQWDAGIRVGLTEAADDFGVFIGVSMRF